MKKTLAILMMTGLMGLTAHGAEYRDGVYRGNFIDRGETQANVQFELKDDIVVSAKYRALAYRGQDYLKNEKLAKEKAKYEAALKSTIGKNIDDALEDLYYPEKIEMAGASVRSNKIRSSFQDALNRGAYKIVKEK